MSPRIRTIIFIFLAAIAGLAYGLATFVYALFHDRASSLTFIILAALAAGISLIAVRRLRPRRFPQRTWLPFLIWLAAAVAAVPFVNADKDDAGFVKAAGMGGPPPAGADLKRSQLLLDLDAEVRPCTALPRAKEISQSHLVSDRGWYTFGIGAFKSRGPAVVKLVLQGSDARPVVVDTVTLPRRRSAWIDRTVDLSAWAGQPVTLTFQADGPASASPSENAGPEDEVYISNPRFLAGPKDRPPKNVILVVIDTTRFADVSSDPARPGLTPHLAELAARGSTFKRHYAQSAWTMPSMASIITSRMPIQTGVVSSNRLKLDPRLPTLAEIIQNHGLRTAGFSSNELVRADTGFSKGFDAFTQNHSPLLYCLDNGERLNRRVLNWLDQAGDAPFFMWLIYIDPHDPYLPPSDYIGRDPVPKPSLLGRWRAFQSWGPIPKLGAPKAEYEKYYRPLYQGEVQYVDHCLGALLEALSRKGLLDQTLVIVTADHGEEFLEHGLLGHGTSLYDELIHVPLIVFDGAQPQKGRVVNQVTQNLDLFPTILQYLGIEVPPEALGASILPLLDGSQPGTTAAAAFSELPEIENYTDEFRRHRAGLKDSYHRAIITDRSKLIEQTDLKSQAVRLEFYDLASDPGEHHPSTLADSEPATALRQRLDRFFDQLPGKMDMNETVRQDPEMIKRLKALGYIH
jgi:arylsulfatase A-like enzyme